MRRRTRSPTRRIKRSPVRRQIRPIRRKRQIRTVIKRAPKGKKPTRFRFKGNRRLGFRNNKVVEIVKFNPRKTIKRTKRKHVRRQRRRK